VDITKIIVLIFNLMHSFSKIKSAYTVENDNLTRIFDFVFGIFAATAAGFILASMLRGK